MSYEVFVAAQPRRPIAAVAAATTWDRFPGKWRGMLDEVWACLRQAGVKGGRKGRCSGYRATKPGRPTA
jgi:hypothetical protein